MPNILIYLLFYIESSDKEIHLNLTHVPYYNSVIESFFANMKREELYRTKYNSEKEFRSAVDNYIQFYNEKRPHSKNHYKTPDEKEKDFYSKNDKKSA